MEGAKIVSLSSRELYTKANYQDFSRYQEVDLAIGGDAEESLPALIELINVSSIIAKGLR